MVEYAVLAILCLVVGFGLGRLRLHSVARHIRQFRKPQGGRAHTLLLDRESAIEIWKQTFAESSQVARDLFKWLAAASTTGLTASAALWAVRTHVSEFQTAAGLFAVALVATSLPVSRMSTRLHDNSQKLGARIARTPKERPIPVSLPYVWRPGTQTWVELLAISLLALAIFVFLQALGMTE